MPKKGKGKAKGPAFLTDTETCRPFGFNVGDILLTPLGVEVTIIGVKPDASGVPKLWAEFQSGFQSPLMPSSFPEFEEQGYKRVHEGRHILRDKADNEKKKQEMLDEVDWAACMPWLTKGGEEEVVEDPKGATKKKK